MGRNPRPRALDPLGALVNEMHSKRRSLEHVGDRLPDMSRSKNVKPRRKIQALKKNFDRAAATLAGRSAQRIRFCLGHIVARLERGSGLRDRKLFETTAADRSVKTISGD